MKIISFLLSIFLSLFISFPLEASLIEDIEKDLKTHSALLNSSHNKDIVVFLGKTGSGKSTVINYLLGKELLVKEDGDLDLKNNSDSSAMRIGNGSDSETTFPKSAMYKDLLLYDFPGLEDTKGARYDLLNALFVKDIIEKSKSVRFVFVAGKGEIEEGRGENLKKLIGIATDLIKGDIKDSSCLVITKNDLKTTEELGERIRKKCGQHPILNEWIKDDRLSFMSKPNAKEIRQEDRELILKSIYKTISTNVKDLFLDTVFKGRVEILINDLYGSARIKHIQNSEKKEINDDSLIDDARFWCFWYKASAEDRSNAKLFARTLRHLEELEDDRLIQVLRNIYPSRYEAEVKSIYDLRVNNEVSVWFNNLYINYQEDLTKWCFSKLTKKQTEIVKNYIIPIVEKKIK